MSEEYNGYANRETWAFNLHWQNDEGLYQDTLSHGQEVIIADEQVSDYGLGESVVDYWREYLDDFDSDPTPMPEGLRMFEREVGSWWRIDCTEVGAAVRESLSVEGT